MISTPLGSAGRAIYVGNLPEGTRSKELEDIFHKASMICGAMSSTILLPLQCLTLRV